VLVQRNCFGVSPGIRSFPVVRCVSRNEVSACLPGMKSVPFVPLLGQCHSSRPRGRFLSFENRVSAFRPVLLRRNVLSVSRYRRSVPF